MALKFGLPSNEVYMHVHSDPQPGVEARYYYILSYLNGSSAGLTHHNIIHFSSTQKYRPCRAIKTSSCVGTVHV